MDLTMDMGLQILHMGFVLFVRFPHIFVQMQRLQDYKISNPNALFQSCESELGTIR